ncbi:histidine phosphatase family protein [Vibrio sp. SCSIO 43136]|uniref:histidine phosphatase family protein n=1 Tax=Vibrio sp. SCSIO 43136 TaxID=2819101 RepID=UPI00207536A4|nr:histidine phosphatase family protein [Vibrio sp. SCSIO 43136]USD63984.1 histidine phosphatase family protein [Vibrio sp. SCSIO 43136]
MQIKRVTLVRHQKVMGDAALNGHTDAKVDQHLHKQLADAIATIYPNIDEVMTSPLSRCYETAANLASSLAVPCTVDTQFREISFGDFDGVAFHQLQQQWPLLEAYWEAPASNTLPNGEPLIDFKHRVQNAWQALVDELVNSERQHSVLVCHGGVIRMILADVLALDATNPKLFSSLAIENGSLTELEIYPATPPVIRILSVGTKP